MGYTHYWEFKKSPKSVDNGAELFKLAVQATKDCIAQVPADLPTVKWGWNSEKQKYEVIGEGKVPFKLCGGNGWGEPKFNDDVVCFNGDASKDYDHETCYLSMDSKIKNILSDFVRLQENLTMLQYVSLSSASNISSVICLNILLTEISKREKRDGNLHGK